MSRQATLPLVAVLALHPLPPLSPISSRIPRVKPTDPRREDAFGIGARSGSALEIELRRSARRGQPITLGTAEDPYAPATESDRARSPLTALTGFEGLEVTVTTRSPEIVRDLGLLAELDRRCSVTVDMLLATLDPFLVRRLEDPAPDPKARLRAVARLTAEGIAVRVLCTPLRPGLNDTESALRQLFAAAREAGAQDVLPAPDRSTRLARLRGALSRQPRRQDPADFDRRLAVFRRLRLEHGFPRPIAGRG